MGKWHRHRELEVYLTTFDGAQHLRLHWWLKRNDTLINPENEPKLKGNSILSQGNETLIKKGIFTSCKDNNNCPPWVITAKEIVHNKNKKEIKY